jgi:hypothetical protein
VFSSASKKLGSPPARTPSLLAEISCVAVVLADPVSHRFRSCELFRRVTSGLIFSLAPGEADPGWWCVRSLTFLRTADVRLMSVFPEIRSPT